MFNLPRVGFLSLAIVSVVFVSSCSRVSSLAGSEEPKKKNLVELPVNALADDKDVEYFRFTEREFVLALTKEDVLYREQYNASAANAAKRTEYVLKKEDIPGLLKSFLSEQPPDRRIVYFKADRSSAFGNVLEIFQYVRKAEIDRVGVVVTDQDEAANRNASGFEVKLPAEPKDQLDMDVKPNPLTLVASLGADGRMTLNNENNGRLPDTQQLESKLKEIFNERTRNAVFREGTNEVEKLLFLKVSKANKYADFVKLLSAVKHAGAYPVGVQIDEVD